MPRHSVKPHPSHISSFSPSAINLRRNPPEVTTEFRTRTSSIDRFGPRGSLSPFDHPCPVKCRVSNSRRRMCALM